MNESMDFDEARKRIAGLTAELVAIANKRAEIGLEVGRMKMRTGVKQVRDSVREASVIKMAQEANSGPLSDEAIARIVQAVIDETSALQAEELGLPEVIETR